MGVRRAGNRCGTLVVIALAIAALLSAVAPGAAHASSVVYIDGGNVWLSSPDGAIKRQLTTDGTPDQSYGSVSQADNEMVLAASYADVFVYMLADGTVKHSNIVPMHSCGGSRSIGPIGARLSADGGLVAYDYFCMYGPPSYTVDARIAITDPRHYTAGGQEANLQNAGSPSWFGERLVGSNGGNIGVQPAGPPAPFTDQFDVWMTPPGGERYTHAEVTRAGDRVLVQVAKDGPPDSQGNATLTYEAMVAEVSGAIPGGSVTERCRFPTTAAHAIWSPAGDQIAFEDAGGVEVSPPIDPGTPGCFAGPPTLISATGRAPQFGPITLSNPAPSPNPDDTAAPAKPNSGDTAAPAIARLSLSSAAFRAAASGGSTAASTGTTVRYRLSEAATTTFTIQRALAGRRAGRRCGAQTRSNRRRPRCTRYVTVRGSFAHAGKAGANGFRFTGRLNGRKLRRGRYRLTAVARDAAGNRSAAARRAFRIVR